jgi:hypothetical protein
VLVLSACGAGDAATKGGGGGASGDAENGSGGSLSGAGGANAGNGAGSGTGGSAPGEKRLPYANAPFDYQIGGDYPPPSGVMIVSRDREGSPAPGLYNICYVNGFQAQPSEESFWLDDHPELVLRDAAGDPVIDADWDEMLLDGC